MLYGQIPYVDKKVSRIIYGTAMPPFMFDGDGSELLEAAFAAGIHTFDLARNYMYAEKSVGRWLEARGRRKDVVLISKCAHPSRFGRSRVTAEDMKKDLERSLRDLRTDHIDIYLLHRDDPSAEVGMVVETLNEMHAAGKIGAFGGSNWTYERIEEANEYAYAHQMIPFSVSSPNFGLADQIRDPWGGGCVTISGPANEDARAWYRKNQMPVIAYSSLGRGLFSGRVKSDDIEGAKKIMDQAAWQGYGCEENFERLRRCEILAREKHTTVSSIAMNWIFGQDLNVFAVVSTSKPERMKENVQALELNLTREELEYLDLRRECLA